MRQISPQALQDKIINGDDLQLIDVREPAEHELFNIGGIIIPFSELMGHISKIETNKTVIFYCKVGIRSQLAIQRLEARGSYNPLVNLQGGIEAWKKAFGISGFK